MDTQILGFALAAGLVAALNPCGFAMLPPYLTLVILGENPDRHGQRQRSDAALGRAVVATMAMALGFLVVFGAFGLIIAPVAASVQRYLPAITVVIGVGLLGLGVWMLTGREVTLMLPKRRGGAPTARLGSMFGYGIAYAIASLSCTIGPFLVVTTTTFRGASTLEGILAYLAYAAGMTLMVGVLAAAVALASSAVVSRTRLLLPYINRVGGGLVVLAGLYVGYYGVYELRLFLGDGSASDPVIDTAGAIQQTLSRWVDTIGVAPILAALAVLLTATAAGTLVWRRRTTADRVDIPTTPSGGRALGPGPSASADAARFRRPGD